MRIDILTACPELLESPLNHSIVQRAKDKGLVEIYVHNLRDFTLDKHRKIDDYAFGFGAGMITFLIRKFGGYPEGVMFSILIMNAFAPFLNNLTCRKYGYGKKGNRRSDISKINMEFDLNTAKERKMEGENV